MLLIGDIHITSRYKDHILDGLRAFVAKHPNEQDIVFFGDYVYHFSYDRSALLALYNFFLELFGEDKRLYIMSGNHDWLGDSFVFQEAQQAFDLIKNLFNKDNDGSIKFITQAEVLAIQGRNILFLPRSIGSTELTTPPTRFAELINQLKSSSSKHEQHSGIINHIVVDALEKHGPLVVFHHNYFNNTRFPGQNSIFRYHDIALTEQLFEVPELSFVSGHLHQAFTHKNYLCLGNVWSSSPLETNQNKFLFVYNPADNSVEAEEIVINPYITLNMEGHLDPSTLTQELKNIQDHSASLFSPDSCWLVHPTFETTKVHQIQLSLCGDNLSYDELETYMDYSLLKDLKTINLKRNFRSSEEILEDLHVSTENLSTGFSDWKTILHHYLEKKYPDQIDIYKDMLKNLKLL